MSRRPHRFERGVTRCPTAAHNRASHTNSVRATPMIINHGAMIKGEWSRSHLINRYSIRPLAEGTTRGVGWGSPVPGGLATGAGSFDGPLGGGASTGEIWPRLGVLHEVFWSPTRPVIVLGL